MTPAPQPTATKCERRHRKSQTTPLRTARQHSKQTAVWTRKHSRTQAGFVICKLYLRAGAFSSTSVRGLRQERRSALSHAAYSLVELARSQITRSKASLSAYGAKNRRITAYK